MQAADFDQIEQWAIEVIQHPTGSTAGVEIWCGDEWLTSLGTASLPGLVLPYSSAKQPFVPAAPRSNAADMQCAGDLR
jgi:hypothetical protein